MSTRPKTRPVIVTGFAIIFLTFGVFGGWAAVAKLDAAVVAPGTLSLEGNRRVVQHLEGGIVEEVFVREADFVQENDVLLRLRDVEAASNVGVVSTRLTTARITEARLLAERSMASAVAFPEVDGNAAQQAIIENTIADQNQIFEDRRSILKSRTEILQKRLQQLDVQIEGLELQKSAFERRIDNFTQMIDRMRDGESRGLIQSNVLSQREDELIQIEASLGQVISEIAQTRNSVGETELEILQLEQQYKERASTELEEVRAEISELEERLKVADDVLQRTEVRSPGSGTIQNLQVHTVGSVVQPGEVLMELVPEEERLIINARVNPLDIDSIAPGLETEVRFTAFKTNLTAIMLGEVASISRDIIEPENPNEQPYFLARVEVADSVVPDDIRERLTAGMPADVVITTGERTMVEYLTAPLVDAVRKSLNEE